MLTDTRALVIGSTAGLHQLSEHGPRNAARAAWADIGLIGIAEPGPFIHECPISGAANANGCPHSDKLGKITPPCAGFSWNHRHDIPCLTSWTDE